MGKYTTGIEGSKSNIPCCARAAGARNICVGFADVTVTEVPVFFQPDLKGDIEFTNVSFRYPSRPNVRVLSDVSFSIPAGNTIALVGASGCGKSTIVALLQRFYDPEQGSIVSISIMGKHWHCHWTWLKVDRLPS
jgi:ABC-type multidrug transport system fused ATPase/permease subunit